MANQLITSMSRRELLVGATAATAQLATPAIVHAQPKALRSACCCRAPATWHRPAKPPIVAP